MALAAKYRLLVYMLDAVSAFIDSDLDKLNYMEIPKGL